MHRFANPARFLRLANAILPWSVGLAVILTIAGLVLGLGISPPDYQQKDTVRIMYVHVPAAWMGMFAYAGVALASAVALIWKHPLADLAARASSPVGAAFTFICLVTGSLWGRPTWGTYWEWDGRMTSMLILLFLYLGHIALVNAFDDPTRGARAGAILALVGVVDLPVIKYSVDWWNSLHQQASLTSLSKMAAPAIDPQMLWPLLTMALAFKAYYVAIVLVRMRSEIAAAKARAIRLALVHG